jgi:basic membrane protein A and related proteins
VNMKRWLALAGVALVAAVAVAAAGSSPARHIRMAVVTDIGGLNDKGFNQSANRGRLQAQRQLRIRTRVYDTRTAADRLPNLRAAAQAGYNLVFPTGFLLFDAVNDVAPAFPRTKFAAIDIPQAVSGRHPNVRGLIFAEHEAGYLVGYIAGRVLRAQSGPNIVSAIGANAVPAIIRYIAGYRAGVKRAYPGATVLVNYANDPTFNDQAKCAETALNQLGRNTQIVFVAAGGCGLGALSSIRARGRWGIGVDVDQSFLGRHILTSALKNITTAVVRNTREFETRGAARYRTGFDKIYNVKNNGVGVAPLNRRLPKALRTRIERGLANIKRLIASGRIKPPTR